MNKRNARLSQLVALLALGGAFVAKPASAQTGVFNAGNTGNGFFSTSPGLGPYFYSWWDSITGRTSFRLTSKDIMGTVSTLTMGFSTFPVRDREWDFNFGYEMNGGSGGDGLAFVVWPGPARAGSGGYGLGYMGAPCFAVEFDAYNNPELLSRGWGTSQWMGSYYETREDGIQAALGDWGGTPLQTGGRTPFNVRGTHSVRITCRRTTAWGVNNPRRISVFVDGAASPQFAIVIPANYLCDSAGQGRFGITASTGGSTDNMTIFPDWSFQIF
jgi:hypothetical protein